LRVNRELAKEYRAPVAVDLLLRRAGIGLNGAVVTPRSIEPKSSGMVVRWLVMADGQALFVQSHQNGSALLRLGDNQHLATVPRAEIEAHPARVEAGAVKPA
jgi:hypothetical protein